MKALLLALSVVFLSAASNAAIFGADELQANNCHSGDLYRALVGSGIQMDDVGSKIFAINGTPLVSCLTSTATCAMAYNTYDCTITFKELKGADADLFMENLASGGGGEGNRFGETRVVLWETPYGQTPEIPCGSSFSNCTNTKSLVCVRHPQSDCKIVTEARGSNN